MKRYSIKLQISLKTSMNKVIKSLNIILKFNYTTQIFF